MFIFETQMKKVCEFTRQKEFPNASALLIDTRTMHIKATKGSANFHDASILGQVDGTNAKRSPGSTLKPFIYGLWI